jgi:hypothetical protein
MTASVEVVNNSGSTVVQLTITLSSSSSPDPDLLQGDSIPSGSSRTFDGFAPGQYTMIAEFSPWGFEALITTLTAGQTETWVLD